MPVREARKVSKWNMNVEPAGRLTAKVEELTVPQSTIGSTYVVFLRIGGKRVSAHLDSIALDMAIKGSDEAPQLVRATDQYAIWTSGRRMYRTEPALSPAEVLSLVTPAEVFTLKVDDWVVHVAGADFQRLQVEQMTRPCAIGQSADRRQLWWHLNRYYWADDSMSAEEVELTLWDAQRRRDSRFERLRKIRAQEEEVEDLRRERIPDDVRLAVWTRDEGRCVRCGASADLQFDHVIPVARGGGNSVENVQILCGTCNRAKGSSIV